MTYTYQKEMNISARSASVSDALKFAIVIVAVPCALLLFLCVGLGITALGAAVETKNRTLRKLKNEQAQ